MKLTYWIAVPTDDVESLAVRAKTKKELIEKLEKCCGEFTSPHKVVVEYDDGFDLLQLCLDGTALANHETFATIKF